MANKDSYRELFNENIPEVCGTKWYQPFSTISDCDVLDAECTSCTNDDGTTYCTECATGYLITASGTGCESE